MGASIGKGGTTKAGWFIRENPSINGFRGTPMYGNPHIYIWMAHQTFWILVLGDGQHKSTRWNQHATAVIGF
jgi:hypothetical protein